MLNIINFWLVFHFLQFEYLYPHLNLVDAGQKTQSVAGQQMVRGRHGNQENAVCRFLSKEVVIERVPASVVARESAEAVRGPSVSLGKREDTGKRIGHQDIFQQHGSGGEGQCDANQPAVMWESRSSLTTLPTSKRAETVTACPPVGLNPLKSPISTLSMGPVSLDLTRKVEDLKASVRARWEELTDALEKERLGLPKIRTGSSSDAAAMLSTSPRDSGCVKRIAQQVKAMECLEGPALLENHEMGNVEELNKWQHWWNIQQKPAVVF